MDNYSNVQILKTNDGRRYYSTLFYPELVDGDDNYYVITENGDRLDKMAYQFYNDVSLWKIIAANNPHIRKDRLTLDANIQLKIPIDASKYIDRLRDFNEKR